MFGNIDVSIIIVTYNSQKDIKKCIDSIVKNTKKLSYEIIIVDNGSRDNTIEIIKACEIEYKNIMHHTSENRGFSYGNNIGMRSSKGKYIALINPDTIFINDVLYEIIDNMKKLKNPGACGARIYNENLEASESYNFFPSISDSILRVIGLRKQKSTFVTKYEKGFKEVDCPIGACFVFNSNIINKIGYMDEGFFLYFDDTDYAFRIKEEGYCNYIIEEAKLIHLQGQSTRKIKESIMEIDLSSYVRFLKKHRNKLSMRMIIYLYIIENYLKFKFFSLKKNEDRKEFYKSNIKLIQKII